MMQSETENKTLHITETMVWMGMFLQVYFKQHDFSLMLLPLLRLVESLQKECKSLL